MDRAADKRASLKARFFSKTKLAEFIRLGMETPCLEWTAYCDRWGYGQFRLSGRMLIAHRVAWMIAHGPIPDGLCALHRCDNPPCVRDDHLFLGTQADNNADMIAKGRHVAVSGERHGSRLHSGYLPRGERHWGAKLDEDKVKRIFRLRGEGWTQTRLGAEFGVSRRSIGYILARKKWAHVSLVTGRDGVSREMQAEAQAI